MKGGEVVEETGEVGGESWEEEIGGTEAAMFPLGEES